MSLQKLSKVYLSKNKQSALGTHFSTNTNFMRILPTEIQGVFPNHLMTDDRGRGAREFAGNVCAGTHWEPIPIQLQMPLDFDACGRLALRAFGGTPAQATPGGGTLSRTQSASMLALATSRQLPVSDLIVVNDGWSFLFGDMGVAQMVISQEKLQRPQVAFDLVNTGYFVTPHGVASLSDTVNDPSCLNGSTTTLTWTENGSTYDLYSATGIANGYDVRNHQFTFVNPFITGEVTRKASNPTCGPSGGLHQYVQELKHNGERRFTGNIGVVFDATAMPGWVLHAKTTQITNLIIKYVGSIIEGALPYYFQITIPKARVRAVAGANFDGDLGYNLQIEAEEDSVTLGGATIVIQNDITTTYN